MKYLKSYNESIRDKMTAVSEEDIVKKIERMHPTPKFFYALEYGYLDIAKKTFEEDGHLIDVDRTDGLALEDAARKDDMEIVEYLFSIGADPNMQMGRLIRYPIHNNNIEMLKMFLDAGFKLLKPDGYNDALTVAKRDGRTEMVKLIEEYSQKQK